MAHPLLVSIAELPQFGLPWDFLDQFRPVPIDVKVSTAGALGTMAIQWRKVGDTDYSAPVTSDSAAPWSYEIRGLFAVLSFPAGVYVLAAVYRVSVAGVVTNTGGGPVVTATRYDPLQTAVQAATDAAIEWMAPNVVAPLLSWGASTKRRTAEVVKYYLKSDVGLAPAGAQVGDENVRARYLDAERDFRAIGASAKKPADLVDSSPSAMGGGVFAEADSEPLRGW